jgi:hypothetical protein
MSDTDVESMKAAFAALAIIETPVSRRAQVALVTSRKGHLSAGYRNHRRKGTMARSPSPTAVRGTEAINSDPYDLPNLHGAYLAVACETL